MENLVKKIITNRIQCFFISPHLDDAVLSCGSLLHHLADKTKITVITIFTQDSGPPFTKFVKDFIRSSGFRNSSTFYKQRRTEDKSTIQLISSTINFHHLGFIDAAWRKKFAIVNLYPDPNYLLSGQMNRKDKNLIHLIRNKLLPLFPIKNDNNFIFIPLGIGNHIDHLITRDVCQTISSNCIYYADFPYILNNSPDSSYLKRYHLRKYYWSKNLKKKKKLILSYKTQIKALFPNGSVPIRSENYYY